MRIMQVIPELCFGGAETMCTNLSIELKKMGHDVLVVSLYTYKSDITERLIKNDVQVVYLDKKAGLNLGIIKKLMRVMKEFNPDVVHTHLYAAKYAQVAATISGVKCRVHTIHNVANKDGSKADQVINHILIKKFGVIPVSLSHIIQETVSELYGISKQQTPVVYNGVPLNLCIHHVYYHIADKFIHIGRFSEQKNHAMMISAFVKAHKINDKIELHLYGEGELLNVIKKMIVNLGASDYIHYCGTVNNPYAVLSESDCFILPSLWEGVPMTLIEAMGTGLPIIASDVGGVSNMLHNNESAILIKPCEEELVSAILQLSSDKTLCSFLGKNALIESKRFSSKKMAMDYLEIYQKEMR